MSVFSGRAALSELCPLVPKWKEQFELRVGWEPKADLAPGPASHRRPTGFLLAEMVGKPLERRQESGKTRAAQGTPSDFTKK